MEPALHLFNPGDHRVKWSIVFFFMILFAACGKKDGEVVSSPEAFATYIESYSSGTIPRAGAIRVRLSEEQNLTHTLNEPVREEIFELNPFVKGKTYWVDARTIEFRPEKELQPATAYSVKFNLGKLVKTAPGQEAFTFRLETIRPAYTMKEYGLRSLNGSNDQMELMGIIETSDVEKGEAVQKILKASLNGDALQINWNHLESERLHEFRISPVKRTNTASSLALSLDGASISANITSTSTLKVPAIGDFMVLKVSAVQDNESYVLVQFSDPVESSQDLRGLITITGKPEPAFAINGSEVKLYVSEDLDGDYSVNVNAGIVNKWNKKLAAGYASSIFFENRLPSVKISGKGVVLPNSGRLLLPFEATNLNAVDVSIIRIYENNIPQFLQDNDLDGEENLRRVAKPVVQATIRLDDDKSLDLHRKQKFSLNIDKYLKTEPGAIYRVTIGFRPQYSLYTCVQDDKKAKKDEGEDEEDGEEDYDWAVYEGKPGEGLDDDNDFWNRYDTYYPFGYRWSQRNNPCHRAYYNREKWASRNVMASNLGILAKRGNNNQMLVVVTDLVTTAPVGGADLELLDYQQQVIGKYVTGNDGMIVFDAKRKPFLLIAKKGLERGYVKLDDGNALPLSRFDVAGEEIRNGTKGFIFGERGVWRPGDSMYISFIVENASLPAGHPVQFDLFTPQGQLYKSITETKGVEGFYVFRTATSSTAPTGNWLAKVKVGGAVFEKRLKVETVMPNRLKIGLEFGDKKMIGKNTGSEGVLTATWLFGATAKHLKAKVEAFCYARKTSFPGLDSYLFDNPVSAYKTQSQTVFEGNLDEKGKAAINVSFKLIEPPPGMLSANLLVKVFEPGGAFSTDNQVLPYSPYISYAGIRLPEGQKPWGFLLTGKKYPMDIVNVDPSGKNIQGNSRFTVEWYKVQWRWWWDNTGDDLSNFTEDKYNKILKKDTVTLVNGKGRIDFQSPTDEWGRYLVLVRDLSSGHTTGQTVYFDDPYWQSRKDNDFTAAAMLSFTSDKEKYSIGDEVRLTIPSSKGGRMLISIENGSRVIKTFWKETDQGKTSFSFPVEKEMAPNVYVNVTLLQPHSQTINDLPIRMYGLIPLVIEDKKSFLMPKISMASTIRSEKEVNVTVSESSGNEMAYNLAIVDEGLLDLTRFKTPDPHAAFFAREALGVKSWDMFDFVLGAWGGGIERILTIGGDEEAAGGGKQRKANRFIPVVKYMGPFLLKKGASNQHQFTLPQYIGAVRVMVVAASKGTYGYAEKSVAVKQPVMLLPSLPRVTGPNESFRLPVTVFYMENGPGNVDVSLQPDSHFDVIGNRNQSITFSSSGEQVVWFDVKVKQGTGVGRITINAQSGKEKISSSVEIDIRNPISSITQVTAGEIPGGKEWRVSIPSIGNTLNAKGIIEISVLPPVNLAKRLEYLVAYPHGCIEQTTSAVFPQLYLDKMLDLSDRQKAETNRNILAAIDKYRNFQRPDGAFSYWPGEADTDEWGSLYAGHFLLEAGKRGYNIPSDMMRSWTAYSRNKAINWQPDSRNFYGADLTQSYRLYLLALARSAEMGAMNRLKEFQYLSPEAKWRLAAAYQLAGQPATAQELVRGLQVSFAQRPSPGMSYGSDLRDMAMVLETLTLMGKRNEAASLLQRVASSLSDDQWYSTQTTSYALLSVAGYCGSNPSGQKIMLDLSVNGKSVKVSSSAYFSQQPIDFINGKASLVVQNRGSNQLFIRVITQGQPVPGDGPAPPMTSSGLSVSNVFTNMEGQPINPESIKQGTDFMARVTITNPGKRGNYTQMALSQVFPSGWEILNTRMLGNEGNNKTSSFRYRDYRDDRVNTYFDLPAGKSVSYFVLLNAAYAGRYYYPGVYCEQMYDKTISGGISGKWIEVAK